MYVSTQPMFNGTHQGTFKCTNEECWVSEYQTDLNAAANTANRLSPWGESLPWKSAGDVEKNRRFFDHWKSLISKNSPRSGGQWQAHEDTSPNEGFPSERRASDDKVSSSSPPMGAGMEPETGDAHTS